MGYQYIVAQQSQYKDDRKMKIEWFLVLLNVPMRLAMFLGASSLIVLGIKYQMEVYDTCKTSSAAIGRRGKLQMPEKATSQSHSVFLSRHICLTR